MFNFVCYMKNKLICRLHLSIYFTKFDSYEDFFLPLKICMDFWGLLQVHVAKSSLQVTFEYFAQ